MKRNLILVFTLGCIALLLVQGLALGKDKEGPLTGTWTCQSKGGSEGDMPFTLNLQQTEDKVDGSVSSPLGGTLISSGSFKGDTLEIHIDSPDGDYVLMAKFDKGGLSGTWAHNDDKGTWEGKKEAGDTR
jgi:hypothetical protein